MLLIHHGEIGACQRQGHEGSATGREKPRPQPPSYDRRCKPRAFTCSQLSPTRQNARSCSGLRPRAELPWSPGAAKRGMLSPTAWKANVL